MHCLFVYQVRCAKEVSREIRLGNIPCNCPQDCRQVNAKPKLQYEHITSYWSGTLSDRCTNKFVPHNSNGYTRYHILR